MSDDYGTVGETRPVSRTGCLLLVRRYRFPRVVDGFLVPATAEPLIACIIAGSAEFRNVRLAGPGYPAACGVETFSSPVEDPLRFSARIRQGPHDSESSHRIDGRWSRRASMVQPRKKTINKSQLKDRRSKNAEAQTWKQQLGSVGYRARLHGHELPSRPRPRQEFNDSADPQSSGAWRYLIRYRRSLRPVHQRRTCGRSAFSFPQGGGHCHEVRVQL